MKDPFVEKCESLCLDFYKVAGMIYRSESPEALAKSLDIRFRDAEMLWEIYWSEYSQP